MWAKKGKNSAKNILRDFENFMSIFALFSNFSPPKFYMKGTGCSSRCIKFCNQILKRYSSEIYFNWHVPN